MVDAEERLMRWLGRAGRLKRKIEFLPSDDDIAERQAARQGLTSPERAVLLAYSKMWLYDELLASSVPEDVLVASMLPDYFPLPLQARYSEPMQRHPLKREILAPQLPALLPASELGEWTERRRVLEEAGVEGGLAAKVASGEVPTAVLDSAEVAANCGRSLEVVASVYFAIGTLLNYGWIAERAMALPAATHWDLLARAAALEELARLKRALTISALEQTRDIDATEVIVENWRSRREA